MFNITNRKIRNQYQFEMLRQMIILERIGARELVPIMNKQYRLAAKLVKNGVYNSTAPVNMFSDSLFAVFNNHFKRTAKIFLRRSFNEINKKGIQVPIIKKDKDKDKKRYLWLFLLAFIGKESAKTTEEINGTTKSLIQIIINKGFLAGKTNDEIAKDLVDIGLISNKRRAMRAARTETHTIAVHTMNETVKVSGVANIKEWITARDERVRVEPFDHRAADGEKVGINEMFILTGEPMEYPGDPGGSIGNVANCRCILSYSTNQKSKNRYIEHKPVPAELQTNGGYI